MKKLLAALVCLTCCALSAVTVGGGSLARQNPSRTELSSQDGSSSYFAKGFKGGGRGRQMGPSSKRRDPNQKSSCRSTEHKKNQSPSNEGKHQKGQDRKRDQNKRADEKNDKRHGNK